MRFVPSRRGIWIGFGAVFLLALTVRLTAERSLRDTSPRRFVSPDCLYHMRRVRFAVAHFPRLLLFDPTIDFPTGAVSIWPPLFDLALALPARILLGPAATRSEIEDLASVVPPVLGALAVIAAGLLARRVRRAYALPAALFVALCGAHVQYSQYGHTDQHVAESLTSLIAMCLFFWAREKPSAGREAFAAVGLAAAVLTWQGAICWGAMIAAVLGFDALRARDPSVARAAVIILGGSAAITSAGVAFWLAGDSLPFAFISFGWFQPAFLLALAAGTIAFELVAGKLRGNSMARSSFMARMAGVLAGVLLLAPRAGDLLRGLLDGIGYVTIQSSARTAAGGYTSFPREMLKQVFEARPLLADGLDLPVDALSGAFFLLPVPLFVWGARAIRGSRKTMHLALAGWGTLTLFLALAQRLNIYYAAPLAALAALETGRQIAVRLRFRLRRHHSAQAAKISAILASGALAVAVAGTLLPGLRRQIETRYEPGDDLIRSLDWAHVTLPHPVDIYDPRFLPPRRPVPELASADAFLSPWSLGHFLTYYAEVPVVADNFGYGFDDSIRFFLASTESEALAIARRRNVRYVFCADLVPKMDDYARVLKRPLYSEATDSGPRLTRAYFDTLQSKLYDFDGQGAPHFRLIYSSRTGTRRFGRFVSRWKIFEIDYGLASGGAAGPRP